MNLQLTEQEYIRRVSVQRSDGEVLRRTEEAMARGYDERRAFGYAISPSKTIEEDEDDSAPWVLYEPGSDALGRINLMPWLPDSSYVCLDVKNRTWSVELKRAGKHLGTEWYAVPDDVDILEMIGWLNGGRDEL